MLAQLRQQLPRDRIACCGSIEGQDAYAAAMRRCYIGDGDCGGGGRRIRPVPLPEEDARARSSEVIHGVG